MRDYGSQLEKASCEATQRISVSLLESKREELKHAEERVERIKEVITLLENHPEMQRLLELLGKGY